MHRYVSRACALAGAFLGSTACGPGSATDDTDGGTVDPASEGENASGTADPTTGAADPTGVPGSTHDDATSSSSDAGTSSGAGADSGSTTAADTDNDDTTTGSIPSDGHVDPIDLDWPEADVVWAVIYLSDDEVSLRLQLAASPFASELQVIHWALDLDQNPATSGGSGMYPFGGEYYMGVTIIEGSLFSEDHDGLLQCDPVALTERDTAIEMRFPRSVYAIEAQLDATLTSESDLTQEPMQFDVVPDRGVLTSVEVDVIPPWDGVTICG